MKLTLVTTLLLVCVISFSHAQETFPRKSGSNSAIIIKTTPLPFLFETVVGGKLTVDQQNVLFTPSPCSEKDKKTSSIFPCNSHLISNVVLGFNEISNVRRRNFLLFIPNRLFIKKTGGETYIFVTRKRKTIIDTYTQYRIQQASLGLK
jgi:hypothetical protein